MRRWAFRRPHHVFSVVQTNFVVNVSGLSPWGGISKVKEPVSEDVGITMISLIKSTETSQHISRMLNRALFAL